MEAIKNLGLTETDFQQIVDALNAKTHDESTAEIFKEATKLFAPFGAHNSTFPEKMRELHEKKLKEIKEKRDEKIILNGKVVVLKQELLKLGVLKTESADGCSK
jgi:hypothetical protein